MPKYTYPMHPDGPIVPVLVGLDAPATNALVSAGVPVLPPFHGKGIIDSGSNITVVAPSLLRPVQSVPVHGTDNDCKRAIRSQSVQREPEYSTSTRLSGPLLTHSTLIVMEMPHPQDVDVIVGRDVLNAYEIHLDGPLNQFHLYF